MPEYEEYPRPADPYYENRHEVLTQGDIFLEVPVSQLGPELLCVDNPPPEVLPVPEGMIPILTYAWTAGCGRLLSDTCHFRHPKASDIEKHPDEYRRPDAVYHNGFIRVAPVFPLAECPFIPDSDAVRERIRQYDLYRRLMYLPALIRETDDGPRELMVESVVALHMADSLHLDLVRRLGRLVQLTRVARQQLNRKLVLFDAGAQAYYTDFEPDMD